MNTKFSIILVCLVLSSAVSKLTAQSVIDATINGGINSGTVYSYPNSGAHYTFAGAYQIGLKYKHVIFKKMALHAGVDFVSKNRIYHNYFGTYVSSPLTQLSYDYIGLVSFKTKRNNEFRFGAYYQNVFKAEEYNTTQEALGIRFQYNFNIWKRFSLGIITYTDVTPSRYDLSLHSKKMYQYGVMFELEYKLFEFKRK